ncbi:14739_t:CDS:2, partial [Dentiscutata erythropus]
MFEYFTDLCQEQEVEFDENNYKIRYLGHIINIAAQDILKNLKAEGPNQEENLSKQDNNIDLMTAIKKLRKIILFACLTPQRKEKFMKYNPNKLELIMDVKTRWNSTYYIIKRALDLKE